MNKIKILAFIAFAAMLSACGSDDGSPPELANNHSGTISPFDTLVVKFNSDLVDVDTSNIILNNGKLIKAAGKELRFIGTKATPGGLYYFDYVTSDSIEFKQLKNSDRYIKDRTVFYFSTYQILDDLNGNNDTLTRAVDLDFANTKTISFAGVLDHKIAASKFNMEDNYKISMRMNDTLKISVKSNDTLNINIIEPGKNSVNENFGVSPKKENKFELTIRSGHLNLDDPNEPASKPADFYIRIFDDNSSAPPNPYTLSISRLR